MNVVIELFVGIQMLSLLPMASQWFMQMYQEFPYLYQGNDSYEHDYTKMYHDVAHAVMAVASVENTYVGMALGLPVYAVDFVPLGALLQEKGYCPQQVFYISDVIVQEKYRKLGIATQLMRVMQEQALSWGYTSLCLATVVRDSSHPLCPSTFQSSDRLWLKLGFLKTDILLEPIIWPTVQPDGTVQDYANSMVLWIKSISAL